MDGLVVNHSKGKRLKGLYAIMVIIDLRLIDKLLKKDPARDGRRREKRGKSSINERQTR